MFKKSVAICLILAFVCCGLFSACNLGGFEITSEIQCGIISTIMPSIGAFIAEKYPLSVAPGIIASDLVIGAITDSDLNVAFEKFLDYIVEQYSESSFVIALIKGVMKFFDLNRAGDKIPLPSEQRDLVKTFVESFKEGLTQHTAKALPHVENYRIVY